MSMTNEAQAALPLNQDSFTAETQGKSEALCGSPAAFPSGRAGVLGRKRVSKV